MTYMATFLEGIITFISPCLLPMLPIHMAYFAGGGKHGRRGALRNALGFILGFTLVFVAMGAMAGTIGGLLREHRTAVDLLSGSVVILLGLDFLGVVRLGFFRGNQRGRAMGEPTFPSSVALGIAFSLGWTPCVGAFLGSALMLAGQQAHAVEGMLLLLTYSAGLGIPFLISALLIDRLKGAMDAIKRHYELVNMVCGVMLVLLGLLMASGAMTGIVSALS